MKTAFSPVISWTIALLGLLLSACHPAPSGPAAGLRMALANAPVSLDPLMATDASSERINRLLYRQLVDFDPQGEPRPDLARWQRLSPRQYRFHLGDAGREFSDGTRLTAEDVRATYAWVLDPAHASPKRSPLSLIDRVQALDADTVDFHLSRPDRLFPAYLSLGIVPARLLAAGHPFRARPVGSGAFRFKQWPEQGRLLLQRRADGLPLTLLQVRDPTVRALKLVRGEVDLLQNDLPPELVGWLEQRSEARVIRQRGNNFTYLGFNLEDPVSGDLRLREAVARAIDRPRIIRTVLAAGARPAQGLFPPEHWTTDPNAKGIAYRPQQARALLGEMGYGPEHPLHLTYKTSADPFRVRLATILQDQLRKVGIQVEIRSYDWGTFYGDIKAGRFQMYSLSWVGLRTPDIYRYIFHSQSLPPNGANRGRYRNAEADRLIQTAEQAPDPARQAALYRQLQARLLKDLPYVPLWFEDQVAILGPGVEGYELASDGNYDALQRVQKTGR